VSTRISYMSGYKPGFCFGITLLMHMVVTRRCDVCSAITTYRILRNVNKVFDKRVLRVSGAYAKLRKTTISFVISVRPSVSPHATTRLPMEGFLWNLIFEDLSKICRENSSFIKTRQE
jgi:hypothetical protein